MTATAITAVLGFTFIILVVCIGMAIALFKVAEEDIS